MKHKNATVGQGRGSQVKPDQATIAKRPGRAVYCALEAGLGQLAEP